MIWIFAQLAAGAHHSAPFQPISSKVGLRYRLYCRCNSVAEYDCQVRLAFLHLHQCISIRNNALEGQGETGPVLINSFK